MLSQRRSNGDAAPAVEAASVRSAGALGWLLEHAVDLAFLAIAAAWFTYALRLSRGWYFWSDDLAVIHQSGSWNKLLQPYNGALSLVSLIVDRVAAEVGHLSFTPFAVAGALSILAVALSYFFTTRRQFGPPLAAVLSVPLLWFNGMNLRPAALNHYLALVGGILCAAALNRSRRADGLLAGGLALSLCSAGGGLVVGGACLVHNALVRPRLRRWIAVLGPLALYGLWWLLARPVAKSPDSPGATQTARIVRDLFLAPFYQAGFHLWPLAAALVVAYFVWGAMQLRGGLRAGANFVAWTAATVAWGLSLVQSRGSYASPAIFRYAYLSLGFVLLAVVPRRPIRWPRALSPTNRVFVGTAAVVLVAFAAGRAFDARSTLRAYSRQYSEAGRKARGAMYVVGLGPGVIPDKTPIRFWSSMNPHGTAGELRALMERYDARFHATRQTIDEILVRRGVPRSSAGGRHEGAACQALAGPVTLAPTTFREDELGAAPAYWDLFVSGPIAYRLWSPTAFTIDVRRFGDQWVRLRKVPANTDVVVTLPALNTLQPWELRADGACLIRDESASGQS